MRHIILGTAGHIDHGKSTLVKAMTGVDPDRLKEEKERGITIDLGFAELLFDDGLSLGIVDVPGHERLIKNMLAGAGGIDIVLMVIAADEGIMPQSREHLAICNLLKIKSGMVVITKSDMVEPEWLEMVQEEVREFTEGSFLQGAEIIAVSSKTGAGIEELKQKIHDLAMVVEPKPVKGLFRLPVDRVFTLKGFGTVITGTAISGSVSVEDQVEILPSNIKTRVRGLHTHGKSVTSAHAGQRTAVNLQGVEKSDLQRGDVLVSAARFTPARAIDVRFEMLPSAPVLKNRSQVHFHLGTSETVARVVLYGTEQLGPGEESYCQLRLLDPVVAQAGDRFVIRRFSPLETIGGGIVLDPAPRKRRRRDSLDDLDVLLSGTLEERIAIKVRSSLMTGMTLQSIEGWVGAEVPDIKNAVGSLMKAGILIKADNVRLHRDAIKEFGEKLVALLHEFHEKNPLKPGMPKEEARARLKVEPRQFLALTEMVNAVHVRKDLLVLEGFSTSVTDEEKAMIAGKLESAGVEPPTPAEFAQACEFEERRMIDTLNLLSKEGLVVRINDHMFIAASAYEGMLSRLRAHFAAQQDMTVAEFRDLLGTTRKFALPLLEYLDANKVTMRVGDVRKLLHKSV